MSGLDVVVIIGAAILVGILVAPRLRLALPVVLLLVGIVAGFVPDLRDIHLPSEAVLVLFLPALLFWESLTTSLRRIRADLRGIILTSTVLVGFTAISVAGLATALGMSWAAALILGAAIAPTDATAVGALARSLPPRPLTLLRAESLINDGTALVIYALAVETAVDGRSFTPIEVTGRLALSYAGGVLAGCVIAWMTLQVRRRLDDPVQANVAILLTPFAAFLVAETVHASGVVAAVVCGLIMSQAGPRVGHAAIRRQTEAFWSLGTYVLNGALFVLVGFEVQSAVRQVPTEDLGRDIVLVVAVWLLLLITRFGFLVASAYTIRLIDRRPSQLARRHSNRARVVSTLAGFRGAVSLAAALAVPTLFDTGAPFFERDTIVFVTAGVIVLTLVVQGFLLPHAVRWAHLPADTSVEDELRLATRIATADAAASIEAIAAEQDVNDEVRDRLIAEYQQHLALIDDPDDGPHRVTGWHDDDIRLRRAVLDRKRRTILQLRDDGIIDDIVLRRIQVRYDVEELRLTPYPED